MIGLLLAPIIEDIQERDNILTILNDNLINMFYAYLQTYIVKLSLYNPTDDEG